MLERFLPTGLIWLLIAGLVAGCAEEFPEPVDHEEEAPALWEEIISKGKEYYAARMRVGRELRGDAREDARADLREQVKAWVRELAARHGRKGIEILIDGHSAVPPREELGGAYDDAMAFSLWIMAEVADPYREQAPTPDPRQWLRFPRVSWHGMATATIDTYRDERARNLLLKLATDEELLQTGFRGFGMRTPPAGFALGFLRNHPSDATRPAIEAFLRSLEARSLAPPGRSPMAITEESVNYVRALLASFDYREGLDDEAQREQYLSFERRLWRSWALGPRGHRMIGAEYMDAANLLVAKWQDGDEDFLLRILEEPTSSHEELTIAMHLAHRLSDEGRESLAAIAEGTSDRAEIAKHALQLIARRSGSP